MKRIIFLLLCFSAIPVHAAINGFSVHSRANCLGFNESISWDATHIWLLATTSYHENNDDHRKSHEMRDDARWTKWSNAFHSNESYNPRGPYMVTGNHWRHYTDNTFHKEGWERVSNCSIYNGWWEWSGK